MADDFPPSTLEQYDWITLPAPVPTQAWHHQAKGPYSSEIPTPTFSPAISSTTISPDASASAESQMLWDRVAHGAKVAIVLSAVLGIIVIVLASSWYCCNCCGMRKRRRAQQTAEGNGVLPMHTIQNRGAAGGATTTRRPVSDAPPSYEEAVPPQHQRLAGGIPATTPTSEEDDAVVSDGKTPLSEIPFEDVVLDHVSSQSSGSRGFDQVHHGAGGDTRGHTNS